MLSKIGMIILVSYSIGIGSEPSCLPTKNEPLVQQTQNESTEQNNYLPDYSSDQYYGKLGPKPIVTFGTVYVWIKEFLYAITVLPFWLDHDKAKQAKIYCNHCNRPLDSTEFHPYLVSYAQTKALLQLKQLWYKGDTASLEQFMCTMQNELRILCVPCLAFYGWHVKPS